MPLEKTWFYFLLFSLKSFHPEVHQPPAHALILFHSSNDHEETERAVQNQATMASNSFNIDAEKANRVYMHVFS